MITIRTPYYRKIKTMIQSSKDLFSKEEMDFCDCFLHLAENEGTIDWELFGRVMELTEKYRKSSLEYLKPDASVIGSVNGEEKKLKDEEENIIDQSLFYLTRQEEMEKLRSILMYVQQDQHEKMQKASMQRR